MARNHKQDSQPILSILIPVYNEQATLQKILDQVSSLNIDNYELIIVDDSSKDESPDIIKKFVKNFRKKNIGLRVITHEKNKGKGAAIKTALKEANGLYFIIQDADLEYTPKDIEKVLKLAVENNYRAVYGSRFKGTIKGMAAPNYYANRFYNFVLRRLYNTDITDMHTCYKMVATDILKDFDLKSNGFDYATELISKLLLNNIVVYEVPIKFNGRTKQEGKKIDFKDGIDCLTMLFSYRYGKKRR